MAALFCWLALLALACFWPDFFWLAFGDLSPITFILVLRLTRRRHGIFSAGKAIVLAGLVIVKADADLFGGATDANFHPVVEAHQQIAASAARFGQAFAGNT